MSDLEPPRPARRASAAFGDLDEKLNQVLKELAEMRVRLPADGDSMRSSPPPPSSNVADRIFESLHIPVVLSMPPPSPAPSPAPAAPAAVEPPRPSLVVRAGKKSVDWSRVFFTGLGMVASGLQILDWIGVLPEQMGPLKVILAALLRLSSG
jgi:hypothetical protein